MDMRYSKWERIIPLFGITFITVLFILLMFSLNKFSKQRYINRTKYAQNQCTFFLERSRTYEDSTDALRDVVSGYKCVYWLTKDTSNVK